MICVNLGCDEAIFYQKTSIFDLLLSREEFHQVLISQKDIRELLS